MTAVRLTRSSGTIRRSGFNYRTTGVNAFQLVSNDYPSARLMSHAEVDSLLDKAVTLGAGLVRAHTLGVSVGDQSYHLVSGVTGTTTPVVGYRSAVWEVIDYAVQAAGIRGLYLMVPMTDELGYYHGGKRTWVNFRRSGTCSTDFNVKSANSSTERAAEGYFYTDTQIVADFRAYVSDWLNHVNQYTGVAFKDDPTVAIIETGNEMWTAAQDAPTWTPGLAAYIKTIAPNVLVADGAATDGQAIVSAHLNSTAIDIHGTHPYSTFTASDVTSMAAQAATAGKAFQVGEYPWSKTTAPGIEQAALAAPNCFATAFWSLQNDSDLHNNGAAYGSDDVSLYVPGKDSTQIAAVSRLKTLAVSMTSGFDGISVLIEDNGDGTPAKITHVVRGGAAVPVTIGNIPAPPVLPRQPLPPDTVTGTAASTTAIDLTWSAAQLPPGATPVTGYKVFNAVTGALLVTLGNVLSTQVTGFTAATSYTFSVKATNSVGDSDFSDTVQVTTNSNSVAAKPNAPTNVTASPASSTSIAITWTAATLPAGGTTITAYKVYTASGTLVKTLGVVTNTTVTGLSPSSTYSYKVTATNSGGESANSVTATATTPAGGTTVRRRRLGAYEGGAASDTNTVFGSLEVSTSYYQSGQTAGAAEIARVKRGTMPVLGYSSMGTTDIATTNGGNYTKIDPFLKSLDAVSRTDLTIPVYATWTIEYDVKVHQGQITGADAASGAFGRALSTYITRGRSFSPLVQWGLWVGGSQTALIDDVLNNLTVPLDWISIDPYAYPGHGTAPSLSSILAPKVSYLRGHSQYARLGSPVIGISETGIDTRASSYSQSAIAGYWTNIRQTMKDLDLDFLVFYNRDRPTEPAYWKIDPAGTNPSPSGVTAFRNSLAAPNMP